MTQQELLAEIEESMLREPHSEELLRLWKIVAEADHGL